MEYHQRAPIGNSIILENFSRYFRFPEGFKNMIYLSQAQQATATKTAVEWWRALKPKCMGIIYWQLNDIWTAPSWSSLEYSGKWKLFMYAVKKFYDDIYFSFFIKDNKINAFVCNDLNQNLNVELTINYYRFDGTIYKSEEKLLEKIEKDESKEIYTKQIIPENNTDYFIQGKLKIIDEKGNMY